MSEVPLYVRRAACPDMDIEVDGGIGPSNIDECAKAGHNPDS